jgi:hypothetical protein
MRAGGISSILAIGFLAMNSLQAVVVPGRWEKVEDLEKGTRIMVELTSGDRLEGAFERVTPQELTITDPDGSDRKLPRTAVAKIETAEKVKDGLTNGMLIGMGVGAGFGVAAAVIATGGVSEECTACGWAIFAGFAGGWGIGTAIDAMHRGPEVLYQAPK